MWLIRHTAVKALPGICYGRSEVPVAESFAADVEGLMKTLRERMRMARDESELAGRGLPRVIWTSPAERCRVVAEILRAKINEDRDREVSVEIRVDERLAELNFGAWESQSWDTLRGPEVDAWMNDPWRKRPPGGETAEEMWTRVGAFRAERRGEDRFRSNDLVVTHGGVIRAWRSLAEEREWWDLFAEKIAFGSLWQAE
jgi:alpha-ribazole phosphatase